MNKKSLIYYLCMSVLMACIGITVAVTINAKYEEEKVTALKKALIVLEDIGNSNKKGYEINFVKDIDYNEKEDDNEIVSDYNAHYESSGSFKLSFESDESKKVTLTNGFQSFFENGKGFISGTQSESHVINNSEINKKTNETIRKENYNYSVSNEYIIDNNENISVYSSTKYANNIDTTKTTTDSFAGKINKNVLFETVELSIFNTAIDQIMFIDVWDDVNSLLKLIYNSLTKIDYNNKQELSNFIKNKNFSFKINNDNIQISYMIDLDDKLTSGVDNNYENIYFSMELDNNTKEIKNFKFDLSNYYGSILKYDTNNSMETAKINNYYIEGKIVNNTLTRKDTSSVEYKEYTDETKYDFVDQFVNHAIPTSEDINE